MSKLVLSEAYVSLGGTDLSDHLRSITLETSADVVDASCMTDTWKERLAGLKDWKLTLEFAQDFAAASVDATLFPLVGTAAAPRRPKAPPIPNLPAMPFWRTTTLWTAR